MKKSKWLALAGVSLLSVGVLVACSSKSNTSRVSILFTRITSHTENISARTGEGMDRLVEWLMAERSKLVC